MTADAEGYACQLIQSLFDGFGAGVLEPVTGIIAHDRGALFHVRDPAARSSSHPRAPAAHTLLPRWSTTRLGLAAVAGTMGGYRQPQIDAQLLLRAFALVGSPAEAVERAPLARRGHGARRSPEVTPRAGVEAADRRGAGRRARLQRTRTITGRPRVGEPADEDGFGPAHLIRRGRGGARAG